MAFRLCKEARKWFKDIERSFGSAPQFDMYYFCLMAGFSTGMLKDLKDSETSELVDYFPSEYSSKGRLIIALFLARELRRQGISKSERDTINDAIGKLVDPVSASRLSAEGMKLMNRYSHGGFEVLSEKWFSDRPRQLETFLLLYKKELDSAQLVK